VDLNTDLFYLFRSLYAPQRKWVIANLVARSEQFKSAKGSSSQGLHGPSLGRSSRDTVMRLLLSFAETLDRYFMDHAVSPAHQLRPNTNVESIKYEAVWGESVVVKLVDSTNTHNFSQVEVENPLVVVQTENQDPSARGVYTFFALSPGTTELKIMVARADNFAMGAAKIEIRVKEG